MHTLLLWVATGVATLGATAPRAVVDHEPPSLDLQLPVGARSPGMVTFVAQASDLSGVASVTLRLRTQPGARFESLAMAQAEPGRWWIEASIPAGCERLEVYAVAYDVIGNGPATVGSATAPLIVACPGAPGQSSGPILAGWAAGGGFGTAVVATWVGLAWRRRGKRAPEPVRSRPRSRSTPVPTAIKPISERHSSASGIHPALTRGPAPSARPAAHEPKTVPAPAVAASGARSRSAARTHVYS